MLLERGVHGFEGRTAAKPYGLVRALSVRDCAYVILSSLFIYESICLFIWARCPCSLRGCLPTNQRHFDVDSLLFCLNG